LVIDAGREDLAGLFTRAIWECWCVGLYVLLGGPDKYAELEESHRRWLKVYADRWPDEAEKLSIDDRLLNGLGSSPAAPTIEQMAKEVETMLRTADTGPVRYGSFSSYDVFYRLESAFSAHAGVALFERYLEPSEDGSRDEVVASPSRETLRRSAAPLAAAYLAHFGWHVYRAFGISTSELDGLLVQLLEPLGMLIHGADPHGVS